MPDLERALSRISLEREARKDIGNIRSGLVQAQRIYDALHKKNWSEHIRLSIDTLQGHEDLIRLLEKALVSEPPLLTRDGAFVAEGFNAELDEARLMSDEGRSVMAKIQGIISSVLVFNLLKSNIIMCLAILLKHRQHIQKRCFPRSMKPLFTDKPLPIRSVSQQLNYQK